MPIDPSIALSVQQPQMPNVGQSLIQGQQLALQRQTMLSLQQEREAQTADIQAKAAAAQQLAQNNAKVDAMMKGAFTQDPDTGAMLFNTNLMQQSMIQNNMGHLWPQWSEQFDNMNKSAMAMNQSRRNSLAADMWGVTMAGNDPDSMLLALAHAKANQSITPDHEQAIQQALAQNHSPDTVKSIIQHYAGYMPEYQTLANKYASDQAELKLKGAQTAQASAGALKDTTAAAQTQRQTDISNLAAAPNAQAYAAAYAQLPPERQTAFPPPQAWNANTSKVLYRSGLTPDQQAQNALGWANLAETARKNTAELAMQDPSSPKNQERMEQQYATMLKSELMPSSRTGMGTEDKKVNQAIHLLAMFDQNRDAQGNYNIPKAQYAELATGLATLVSPNAAPTDSMRSEIETRTAQGDFNNLMTYVTGTPLNGSTQDVYKMLRDSIVRQGTVAQQNRGTIARSIQSLAPSDLNPGRRARIESGVQFNTMPGARIAVKGPNGQTGTIDANDTLPPGWSKVSGG